ncbi:MAG: hypothetical protein KAT71_06410, partial [Gammaproteobacteria bacterium]|nr:hypothetical protein [Gammaproteobacteria bacterium]
MPKNVEQFSEQLTAFIALLNPAATNPDAPFPSIQSIKQSWQEIAQEHAQQLRHHGWPLPLSIQEQMQDAALSFANFFLTQLKQNKRADDKTLTLLWNGFIEAHKIADRYVPLTKDYFARITALKPQIKKTFKKPPTSYIQQLPKLFVEGHNFSLYLTGVIEGKPVQPPPSPTKAGPPIRRSGSTNGLVTLSGSGPGSPIIAGLSPKHARPPFSRSTTLDPNMLTAQRTRTPPPSPTPPSPEAQWQEIKRSYNSIINKPPELRYKMQVLAMRHLITAFDAIYHMLQGESIDFAQIRMQWKKIYSLAQELVEYSPLAITILKEIYAKYLAAGETQLELKQQKKICFAPPAIYCLINQYRFLSGEELAYLNIPPFISILLQPVIAAIDTSDSNANPFAIKPPQQIRRLFTLIKEQLDGLMQMVTHLDIGAIGAAAPLDFQITEVWRKIVELNTYLNHYDLETQIIEIEQINLYWYQLVQYTKILVRDPSASITKSYPALTGIAKTSPLPPHREIDSQVLQANRAILLEFDNDNPLLSGVINALLVQQRYLNPQHYRCQHLNLLMFFFHLLKQPLPSPRFSMLSELSEYREANLAQLIKTTLILLQQKPVTKAEQELAKLPGNHLEFLITAINIITENRYAISSNYFDLEDIARIIIFLLQNNQTQTYNNLLKLYAENETIVTEADRALTKVKFIIAYLDMLLKSAHPGDYHCTMMLWKETLSLHETVQADGASIVSYSPKLDELRQQIIVIQRQAHLVAFARMINAFNGFFSRPPSNLDDFFKQIEEKWQRIVRFYNTLLDRYGLLPEQLASLQRIALQRVDFIIGHINQMLAVQGPIIDSLLNPLWGKLLQTHLIADEYAVPVTQYDSQVKELRSKIYAACSAQRLNAPPPNLTAELSTPYAAAYQSSKSLNCSQQHSFSPPQRPPFNRSQSVATLPLATTTTAPPPLLSRASETTLTRHLDPRQQFNPHQGLRHTPDLRHNMQKTTMDSLVTAFKQLQSKLYPHALETMALQSANRIATQATGFSMSHQEELEQADKDQDKHDQIMKPMEASQQEAERAHLALMAAIEALPPGITESEPITEKYIADQWRRIAAIAQQLNRHQPLALPTLAKVFNAYQQVATMHIALKMGKKTVSFPPPALTDIIPAYNQVAREIVATFVTKEEEIPAELIPLLPKHKLNPEPLVGHSPQNLALLHLIALLRELANNLVELDLLSHDKILPEIQQKMRTISQLNQELEGYGRVSPRNIHIQQLNLEWQLIAAHLTNLRTRYQILAFPSAPPRQFLGTEINIPRAKKTVTARAKAAVKPAPGRNNYHGPDALEDTSALGADVEQIDCNAYGLYFSLVTNNGKHYLCSLRRLAEITYHTEKKLQSTPMYFYGPHGSGTMISIATSITTNINNADPVRKLPQIIEALIDRENNHHFQNGQQLTLIAFFFYTLRQPRRMQQKPPLLEELTGDNTSILAELIKIFLAILYAEKRKQLTIDQQLVVQEEMQRDLLVVVEHIACRFSAQDISKICSNFAAIDYAHLIVFLLSKQKTKAATKIFLTLPSEHTAGVIGAIHTASIAHKNNELFYLFTLYDHLSDTEREQFWNRFSPEQRGCLYPLANKPFSFDGHTFSEIHKLLKYYHSIKYTAANLLYLYHEVLILILAAQPTITRDGQKTLSPEVLGIINKNGLEVLSKQLLFLIKTASIVYHSNHDSQPEFEKLSQQREWLHEPKVILPILFHQQRFNPIKTQPTLTPPKMIVYWRHANKLRLFLLKVVGNADAQLDDDDWYKTIKLRLSEQTEYFISDPANIEREELVFQLRDYLGKNYNEQDEKLRLLLERLDGKLYDTYNKGTRGTLTPMLSWPANKILPINRIRISHIYFSRRQEFAETEINTFLINMKEEITRKESV